MYNNKFCVLIADDEIRLTRGLTDFFRAKNFNVFSAHNGQDALDIYYSNNEKIDIVLLDIMMPKLDGIAVLKELRTNETYVPVIMLTAKSEDYDELEGLNNGADDYVTKPFSPSVLLARVEKVLSRFNLGIKDEIVIDSLRLNITNFSLHVNEERVDLTRREFDLLCYMINNKNIVLSRETILNSVWGYNYEGEARTVDTHIKQLRIKLGDKAEFIKTVHRVGYVFET